MIKKYIFSVKEINKQAQSRLAVIRLARLASSLDIAPLSNFL